MKQLRRVTVVIAAPKGGVGKTTLTMGLLALAAKSGLKVLGVNTDKQGSLMKWAERRRLQREKPGCELVDIPIYDMAVDDYRKLEALRGYELIVVDTPPGHSDDLMSVLGLCEAADIILIPTAASEMDTDEVVDFYTKVAGRAYFVMNAVNRRSKSYLRSRQRLLKRGKLCPADVPRLESILNQYARGTACADEGEAGALDFEAVWHFVGHELGLATPALGELQNV
jgi:chromosome partitioning protein